MQHKLRENWARYEITVTLHDGTKTVFKNAGVYYEGDYLIVYKDTLEVLGKFHRDAVQSYGEILRRKYESCS